MNKRFLITVVLCAVIPVLAACVVLYQTSLSNVRQDVIGSLTLAAE